MLILIYQFRENRYEKLGINALRNCQMLILIPAKILNGIYKARLHRISKKVSSISPSIKKNLVKLQVHMKTIAIILKKKLMLAKKIKNHSPAYRRDNTKQAEMPYFHCGASR